jgi:hypothetical protein
MNLITDYTSSYSGTTDAKIGYKDIIAAIPASVTQMIGTYLGLKDLAATSPVCKRWHHITIRLFLREYSKKLDCTPEEITSKMRSIKSVISTYGTSISILTDILQKEANSKILFKTEFELIKYKPALIQGTELVFKARLNLRKIGLTDGKELESIAKLLNKVGKPNYLLDVAFTELKLGNVQSAETTILDAARNEKS